MSMVCHKLAPITYITKSVFLHIQVTVRAQWLPINNINYACCHHDSTCHTCCFSHLRQPPTSATCMPNMH